MSWQTDLRARLYLPWEMDEPWFQRTNPQAAWTHCPNAQNLLWVLGRRRSKDVRPSNLGYVCIQLCDRVRACTANPILADYMMQLFRYIDGESAPGLQQLSREVDARWEDDPGLEGRFATAEENKNWLFARMVSDTHTTTAGLIERAHYVGYYAHQLGLSDWVAANIVRKVFDWERFTE